MMRKFGILLRDYLFGILLTRCVDYCWRTAAQGSILHSKDRICPTCEDSLPTGEKLKNIYCNSKNFFEVVFRRTGRD